MFDRIGELSGIFPPMRAAGILPSGYAEPIGVRGGVGGLRGDMPGDLPGVVLPTGGVSVVAFRLAAETGRRIDGIGD